MKKTRIIVIGIDGGTWNTLGPLAERGELPAFKKLMTQGAYGTLMSTVPCRSGTAIMAFYTGKNLSKLGALDFPSFDCDVMNYEKIRDRGPAIWEILGRNGFKSAILNLLTTHPPTKLEGVMLSGFSVSEKDEYTYPKEFKEKVKGFHSERETFVKLISGKQTMENEKELFSLYLRSVQKRYRIIKDVMRDGTFDFLVFWIDESDAIQHDFWGQDNYLLAFFKEIDKNLNDIIENNPDSNIVIFSDHGFDAVPIYEFYPKSWLRKEGYLRLKGGGIQQWLIQITNSFIVKIPGIYRYKLIRFFNAIKRLIIGRNVKDGQPFKVERSWRLKKNPTESRVFGIDWKKTTATNYDFWGIKILRENLNRDYETVRGEIMEKMKRLRDRNGEKIIKYVWKREELFRGPDINRFPDIAYLPASKFLPTGFLPFSITKKRVPVPGVRATPGGHMIIREGIFLAAGPDINKAGDIGELNVLDLAPTILSMFKISVPEGMDGRILKEIVNYDK